MIGRLFVGWAIVYGLAGLFAGWLLGLPLLGLLAGCLLAGLCTVSVWLVARG